MSRVAARPTRPGQQPAAGQPAAAGANANPGPGRPKSDKVDFRNEGDPKLTEWPASWDSKIHKPLKLEDFEAEDVFYLHKAEQYESKAAEFRRKAAIFQQFGTAEARKTAEKYQKIMAQAAKFQAELAELGVDVNQIDVN